MQQGQGLPARRHKANCFRASEPRPYERNDSIIHFPFCCIRVTYLFLILARCGIFVQRVATWRMEYGKN